MRMRMNNEDEISQEARLRKEARELEERGIKIEVDNEPEADFGEEEETVSEAVPAVQEVKKKAPASSYARKGKKKR